MVTKNEGRYLPDAELLAMRRERMTLAQIAEANYQATGFRPDRGNLSILLRDLGAEGRPVPVLLRHWNVRPEHQNSRWRRMLAAKSKELEEGRETLDERERRAIDLLEFLLNPKRGRKFVVTYHWQVGFCLVDAMSGEDYIRVPGDEPMEEDSIITRGRLELVR
jgi:hypothetical protein